MIRLIFLFIIFYSFSSCSNEDKTRSLTFIALGDMPYHEKHFPLYETLIKNINSSNPSLVIHTGDARISNNCKKRDIDRSLNYMNAFAAPVLFTPGDNDWWDCIKHGNLDFIQSLDYIRKTHFSSNFTLGLKPLKLFNQNNYGYPENLSLIKDDIGFITLHVVRYKNQMIPLDLDRKKEYDARKEANLSWLEQSFKELDSLDAIVVVLHANILEKQNIPLKMLAHNIIKNKKLLFNFKNYKLAYKSLFTDSDYEFRLPYRDIGKLIQELSLEFKKPVLLLHGDTHFHRITPPLKKFPNLYIIETFGSPDYKAIEIIVQSKSKNPFKVKQIINSN